ncbi:MAG: hypothetical protein AAGK14_13580 [Verrucomicrobiota bacterium]
MPAPESTPDLTALYRRLDRSCRFGFLTVTALLAYVAHRLVSNIGAVEQLCDEMLSEKALPILTEFVFSQALLLTGLCFLLPVLAVVCAVSIRRADLAIGGICLCNLALFGLSALLWWAFTVPFAELMSGLQMR